MRIPQQVSERVKEAPAQALRAVFSGIGQVLLVADRIKNRAAEQDRARSDAAGPDVPSRPAAASAVRDETRWRSLDSTGNVRLLSQEASAAKPPAAETAPSPEPQPAETASSPEPAAETLLPPEPEAVAEKASAPEPPAAGPVPAADVASVIEAADIAEAMEAAEVPEAVEPAEAIEAVAAAEAIEAIEAAEAIEAIAAAEAIEAIASAEAAESISPVEPAEATGTVESAEAAKASARTARTRAEAAKKPVSPETSLPVPNYDKLTVASLRARLRNLDRSQVEVLLDYEKANAGRAEVLTMFERRIAKLDSSGA